MILQIILIISRIVQLIWLIPIIGMLSYLANGYVDQYLRVPTMIILLLIVSVFAALWVAITLLPWSRARRNGALVAFIDLVIFGLLIASVYQMRGLTLWNCKYAGEGDSQLISLGLVEYVGHMDYGYFPESLPIVKTCSMLKASFAFGIMSVVFFFWTLVIYFNPTAR